MIKEDHEMISEGSDRDLSQVQDQEDQEDLGPIWATSKMSGMSNGEQG